MTSEIAAAYASLKAASEIAQALIGVRDSVMIQSKVLELQGEIIAAQSHTLASQEAQSALLERVRDLEKKVADFGKWNAEKEKYELKEVKSGVFAYRVKPDARGSEPSHQLCAKCYEDHRKSILQFQKAGTFSDYLSCPHCGTRLDLS